MITTPAIPIKVFFLSNFVEINKIAISIVICVRNGSGILLWSDSGIKDKADSPTRRGTPK
jgi:hypothetical protein